MQLTHQELKTKLGSYKFIKSDLPEIAKLCKKIEDTNDQNRVNSNFKLIFDKYSNYPLFFKKGPNRTWFEFIKSADLQTLSLIAKWLRDFSLNEANKEQFIKDNFPIDFDVVFEEFKLKAKQLYQDGTLKLNPQPKLGRPIPIVIANALYPTLRAVVGSFNSDSGCIFISYYSRSAYGGSSIYGTLIHEMVHAYLQSRTRISLSHNYPIIREGVTEVLTMKILKPKESVEHRKGKSETAYGFYTQLIQLLCHESGGLVKEEHFFWAAADTRHLKKLKLNLNKLYSKNLRCKDVLSSLNQRFKELPHVSTNPNRNKELIAKLKNELKG
jgi:hypothetical protein